MKLAEIQTLSQSIKARGPVEIDSSSMRDISQVIIQLFRDTDPDLKVVRDYVIHNYTDNNYQEDKDYIAKYISYWTSDKEKITLVKSEIIANYLDCIAYLLEQNSHLGYPDQMEVVNQNVRVAFQAAGAPLT